MSYAYIPTGEIRQPKKGEWYAEDDCVHYVAHWELEPGDPFPIYRRIDRVVLERIERLEAKLDAVRELCKSGEWVELAAEVQAILDKEAP